MLSIILGREGICIFFNILFTISFSVFFLATLLIYYLLKACEFCKPLLHLFNPFLFTLLSPFSPLSLFLSRQLSLSFIEVYNSSFGPDEEAPQGYRPARSRSGRSTLHVQYFLITLYTALEVGPRRGSWTGPLLEGGENGAHRGGF